MLPLIPQVLAFFLNRDSFVLSPHPPLSTVLALLLPAKAALIAVIGSPRTALAGLTSTEHETPQLFRFFLAWSALPILALYAAGHVAGSPVFLDRYRIVAVLGGALFVGLIVRSLPSFAKHFAVITLALFAVWSMTDLGGTGRDGWREAFAWAESQTDETEDRVLALNPGLIETYDFEILDDPEWTDYLGAHAAVYDFDAPTVILPRTDPSAELLDRRISELFSHDVVVVVDPTLPTRWIDLLSDAAGPAGYTIDMGPENGFIGVAVLSRTNG